MTQPGEIVKVLHSLVDADRQWILQHLSVESRTALLGETDGRNPARAVKDNVGQVGAVQGAGYETWSDLATSDLDAVRAVVSQEPAWIAHVLTQGGSLWESQLRRKLPVNLRSEVERLEAAGVIYSRALVAMVIARVAERVKHTPVAAARSPISRFVAALGESVARARLRIIA